MSQQFICQGNLTTFKKFPTIRTCKNVATLHDKRPTEQSFVLRNDFLTKRRSPNLSNSEKQYTCNHFISLQASIPAHTEFDIFSHSLIFFIVLLSFSLSVVVNRPLTFMFTCTCFPFRWRVTTIWPGPGRRWRPCCPRDVASVWRLWTVNCTRAAATMVASSWRRWKPTIPWSTSGRLLRLWM